jgi:hypothetical protein
LKYGLQIAQRIGHDLGMSKTPKRPADMNQLAKYIVELAAADIPAVPKESEMARRGRVGGLSGGKARADKLSPEKRQEIARRAAESRWSQSRNKA